MSAMEEVRMQCASADSGGGPRSVPDGAPWILVVDDERVVRDLLQRFLLLEGYHVMSAADGSEGLALFHQHPRIFHAVILDVHMPRMDGCDAFFSMRRVDPTIPVVVMSNSPPEGQAAEILGQPATTFIRKPFALGDMLVRIEDQLGPGARPRATWLVEPTSSYPRGDGITD